MMKAYLKSLQTIHMALCIGVAFFMGVAYYVHTNELLAIESGGLPELCVYLVPAFAFLLPSIGVIIFNKKL